MIYELTDTSKVEKLFDGCEFLETAVLSCLQKYAGNIFVTNTENPHSAIAYLGSFGFCAGKPNMELLLGKPDRFIYMVPQSEEWMKMIVSTFPATKKARYAIKKDTEFDREKLKTLVDALPAGYEIKRIDSDLYDMCLEDDDMEDLVCWFGPKDKFLTFGRGLAVLKDGKIVSGAASALRYRDGIEVETDTIKEERHKGLASAACAALILSCLDEGLYPSWDAANWLSVMLAEKLGYKFDREYFVYVVE